MLDLLILSVGSFLLYLVGFPLVSLIIFGTLWAAIMALINTGLGLDIILETGFDPLIC